MDSISALDSTQFVQVVLCSVVSTPSVAYRRFNPDKKPFLICETSDRIPPFIGPLTSSSII